MTVKKVMCSSYGKLAEWGEVNCSRLFRLMLITGWEPFPQQLKGEIRNFHDLGKLSISYLFKFFKCKLGDTGHITHKR